MSQVQSAIGDGRCAIAVSGTLLRDAEIMLALKERAGLPSMALSGPAVAPVRSVSVDGIARAIASPGGVVVVVDPQLADRGGMQDLGQLIARAPNTPTVVVVSRSFNPLLFGSMFPGIGVAHHKDRAKSFLKRLPIPEVSADAPVVELASKVKKKAKGESPAPRLHFVGREDELAQLTEMLGEGGPIVVSGPDGVGKSWLVDHAVDGTELNRLPDFQISWGIGADALFARIAEITKAAGVDGFATKLAEKCTPMEKIHAMVEALAAADGLADKVMVIRDLQRSMGREGDFFRKGRLEMALQALLTNTYPLRVVFQSTRQPVFFRHGVTETLRRIELGGMKGRFYFDIFQAYKAPEFSRDKFGPFSERTHGHPMVARQAAVEVSRRREGAELLDDAKFFKMDDLADGRSLARHYSRRLEKLDRAPRADLAMLSHLREAVDGQVLAELGISRKKRVELLARGLLSMAGTEHAKRYRVHNAVAQGFSYRDVNDFDTFARLADLYRRQGEKSEGIEKLARLQEANRCAMNGRRARSRVSLGYPDNDPGLENIVGMLRGNKPRFDLAQQRLKEVLTEDPSNSEAHLLEIERLRKTEADRDAIEAAYERAMTEAPVPEVFHQAVGFHLSRRARGKAITVMERAIEAIPTDSRLRTRLAALLMRQGRRREAVDNLRLVMEQDPMLPDAYGLLGMLKSDEGGEAIEEAEQLLREAARLAPDDPVQIPRLVRLLAAKARVMPAEAEALRTEAKELLESVLRKDSKSAETYLLLAKVTREAGGDAERCLWLLKKARKLTERGKGGDRGARIALEFVFLDVARGDLDSAERTVRGLTKKEPSNPDVFLALAALLEARQQLIPAHAEMMRALERTGMNSLERTFVEGELARLQTAVEQQVAALGAEPAAGDATAAPSIMDVQTDRPRVIRRAATDAEDEADVTPENESAEAVADASDAVVEAPEAAVEASEAAVEASEAAVEASEE